MIKNRKNSNDWTKQELTQRKQISDANNVSVCSSSTTKQAQDISLPFCLLSFAMAAIEEIYPVGTNQYFLGGMNGWMEVRVRILRWPMYWTQKSRVISHNSVPFRLISHNSVTFRDEFHDFWTISNTSYHNYEAIVT